VPGTSDHAASLAQVGPSAVYLDVSGNALASANGAEKLRSLRRIDLSHNGSLTSVAALGLVTEPTGGPAQPRPSLSCVDLRGTPLAWDAESGGLLSLRQVTVLDLRLGLPVGTSPLWESLREESGAAGGLAAKLKTVDGHRLVRLCVGFALPLVVAVDGVLVSRQDREAAASLLSGSGCALARAVRLATEEEAAGTSLRGAAWGRTEADVRRMAAGNDNEAMVPIGGAVPLPAAAGWDEVASPAVYRRALRVAYAPLAARQDPGSVAADSSAAPEAHPASVAGTVGAWSQAESSPRRADVLRSAVSIVAPPAELDESPASARARGLVRAVVACHDAGLRVAVTAAGLPTSWPSSDRSRALLLLVETLSDGAELQRLGSGFDLHLQSRTAAQRHPRRLGRRGAQAHGSAAMRRERCNESAATHVPCVSIAWLLSLGAEGLALVLAACAAAVAAPEASEVAHTEALVAAMAMGMARTGQLWRRGARVEAPDGGPDVGVPELGPALVRARQLLRLGPAALGALVGALGQCVSGLRGAEGGVAEGGGSPADSEASHRRRRRAEAAARHGRVLELLANQPEALPLAFLAVQEEAEAGLRRARGGGGGALGEDASLGGTPAWSSLVQLPEARVAAALWAASTAPPHTDVGRAVQAVAGASVLSTGVPRGLGEEEPSGSGLQRLAQDLAASTRDREAFALLASVPGVWGEALAPGSQAEAGRALRRLLRHLADGTARMAPAVRRGLSALAAISAASDELPATLAAHHRAALPESSLHQPGPRRMSSLSRPAPTQRGGEDGGSTGCLIEPRETARRTLRGRTAALVEAVTTELGGPGGAAGDPPSLRYARAGLGIALEAPAGTRTRQGAAPGDEAPADDGAAARPGDSVVVAFVAPTVVAPPESAPRLAQGSEVDVRLGRRTAVATVLGSVLDRSGRAWVAVQASRRSPRGAGRAQFHGLQTTWEPNALKGPSPGDVQAGVMAATMTGTRGGQGGRSRALVVRGGVLSAAGARAATSQSGAGARSGLVAEAKADGGAPAARPAQRESPWFQSLPFAAGGIRCVWLRSDTLRRRGGHGDAWVHASCSDDGVPEAMAAVIADVAALAELFTVRRVTVDGAGDTDRVPSRAGRSALDSLVLGGAHQAAAVLRHRGAGTRAAAEVPSGARPGRLGQATASLAGDGGLSGELRGWARGGSVAAVPGAASPLSDASPGVDASLLLGASPAPTSPVQLRDRLSSGVSAALPPAMSPMRVAPRSPDSEPLAAARPSQAAPVPSRPDDAAPLASSVVLRLRAPSAAPASGAFPAPKRSSAKAAVVASESPARRKAARADHHHLSLAPPAPAAGAVRSALLGPWGELEAGASAWSSRQHDSQAMATPTAALGLGRGEEEACPAGAGSGTDVPVELPSASHSSVAQPPPPVLLAPQAVGPAYAPAEPEQPAGGVGSTVALASLRAYLRSRGAAVSGRGAGAGRRRGRRLRLDESDLEAAQRALDGIDGGLVAAAARHAGATGHGALASGTTLPGQEGEADEDEPAGAGSPVSLPSDVESEGGPGADMGAGGWDAWRGRVPGAGDEWPSPRAEASVRPRRSGHPAVPASVEGADPPAQFRIMAPLPRDRDRRGLWGGPEEARRAGPRPQSAALHLGPGIAEPLPAGPLHSVLAVPSRVTPSAGGGKVAREESMRSRKGRTAGGGRAGGGGRGLTVTVSRPLGRDTRPVDETVTSRVLVGGSIALASHARRRATGVLDVVVGGPFAGGVVGLRAGGRR